MNRRGLRITDNEDMGRSVVNEMGTGTGRVSDITEHDQLDHSKDRAHSEMPERADDRLDNGSNQRVGLSDQQETGEKET